MAKPCIVLVSVDPASAGGIASVVKEFLVSEILCEGYTLTHLSTSRDASSIAKVAIFAGAISKAIWCLARRRASLFHIHAASHISFYRKSIIALMCMLFRVKYIVHLHSGFMLDFISVRPNRLLVDLILRHAAFIIFLDGRLESGFLDRYVNRRLIPNPVAQFEIPTVMHRQHFIFLGWLTEEKGIFDLIDAVQIATEVRPDLKVVICGTKGDKEYVMQYIKLRGVERSINLAGWVSGTDKLDLLRVSRALVLPSYAEGMPLAILEAMMAGLPIIASDVGAIPELVRHEVNGLLHTPGDVAKLAAHLLRLWNDDTVCDAMGRLNRKLAVRRFSTESVFEEVSEVYSLALKLGKARK